MPLVNAFNQCRATNLVPGTENVVDESMGNGFRSLKIHLAKFTKIVWKPEGIGVEYKNLADAGTGILLHLEIQEDMSTNIPKHTALLLRLTKMLHGQGHIVYGDSAFASVEIATALCCSKALVLLVWLKPLLGATQKHTSTP